MQKPHKQEGKNFGKMVLDNNVIKKMMKEADTGIAKSDNPLPEETAKMFLGLGRADRSRLGPDWPFMMSLRLLPCRPG